MKKTFAALYKWMVEYTSPEPSQLQIMLQALLAKLDAFASDNVKTTISLQQGDKDV